MRLSVVFRALGALGLLTFVCHSWAQSMESKESAFSKRCNANPGILVCSVYNDLLKVDARKVCCEEVSKDQDFIRAFAQDYRQDQMTLFERCIIGPTAGIVYCD
jgi:hypothetical protein